MKTKKCIMIAGGGTGGHIYPAVAIGRALQAAHSDYKIRFVGTKQGLEKKIMTKENLDLDLIYSGKLNFSGNPLIKIKTLLAICIGFFQSIVLIFKHRPAFVLGVGGYASAPFLLAASLLGSKTAFWEPNAHPGMANRLLSNFVKKSYLVFAEAAASLKTNNNKIVGMPLRKEIEDARIATKLKNTKFHILCFGGSQGSLFLNQQISNFILQNSNLHSQIQLIHQTGSADFQNMKNKYAGLSCVEVHEFIFDMPKFYQKADVQFCRGGASTIAEAACFGVIPIVVPLPAADNHQQKNAETLLKNGAGFMILQNNFQMQNLKDILNQLMTDLSFRETMTMNLKKLAAHNAAEVIAKDMLKEIGL